MDSFARHGCLASDLVIGDSTVSSPPETHDARFPSRIESLGHCTCRLLERSVADLCKRLIGGNVTADVFEVLPLNVGNVQGFGDGPLEYRRQVVACLLYPPLLDANPPLYASDVVAFARSILVCTAGRSIGGYTKSLGAQMYRRLAASTVSKRFGYVASPDAIIYTDGASAAVSVICSLFLRQPNQGVLVPMPHNPTYSAIIQRQGGTAVGYTLDPDDDWQVSRENLEQAVEEFHQKGGDTCAIFVSNTGNPTGKLLRRSSLQAMLHVADRYRLVVLIEEDFGQIMDTPTPPECRPAREVSQQMGTVVPLISIYSLSHGSCTCEPGVRGGFAMVDNVEEGVRRQLLKLFSVRLCPNTVGQAMTVTSLSPPVDGDPSYLRYTQQVHAAHEKHATITRNLLDTLGSIDGIKCYDVEAGIFTLIGFSLPSYIVRCAAEEGIQADLFFARGLLEETGVLLAPGSGFGLKGSDGWQRLTILPDVSLMRSAAQRIVSYYSKLAVRYR